jgi:hypothetical protein
MLRFARSIVAVAAMATPLSAQSQARDIMADQAMATITEQDFATKLAALAHDSTRGRETPSPELARATEWVALQFGRAGLNPAGDDGGYLQAFRLRQERLDSLSTLTVTAAGATSSWALGKELVYVGGGYPAELADVPVVLAIGIPEDGTPVFADTPIGGAAILHVIGPDKLSGRFLNPMLQEASRGGAVAHIVASEIPAELWEEVRPASYRSRWQVVGVPDGDTERRLGSYAIQLRTAGDVLRTVGEDPTTLLTPGSTRVRRLDGVRLSLTPHHTTVQEPEIANVVGVLVGSDPELRHEAVVFTGHIDHVGTMAGRCRPSGVLPADSICNGADDNASGTVGVIELAEAFASLEARPARTLVFAAVTAEERGLCGSRFYVEHPVIPIERTVAEINLDMIARNPPDTVGFVGKDYTSLGAVVDRVLAEHPELGLVAAEHRGRYGASDHFPFVQRGVPALFFFSGEHEDLHTAADNPERADAEQAARIVRLAFLVGLDVANAAERPTWDEEAWRSMQ